MERKKKLLIVEDEVAIRSGLVDVFVYHGYDVEAIEDGAEALRRALEKDFDLVLLDVMLPSMNGFEVCEHLRVERPDQPVIMLTAKNADEDIVQGLSLGADDYIAKPFSVTELVLRVQAVLRRTVSEDRQIVTIDLGDDTWFDTRNLSGERAGEPVLLTRREMEVLVYLYINRERPVTREELLTKVWGYGENLGIETRTVDIHIAKLRRKIEADASSPKFLVTIRGAGYRLNAT